MTGLCQPTFAGRFQPTKILDFVWESDEREWDQTKVDAMRSNAVQAAVFAGDTWRQPAGHIWKDRGQ